MKNLIGLFALAAVVVFISFGLETEASNQDDVRNDAEQSKTAEARFGGSKNSGDLIPNFKENFALKRIPISHQSAIQTQVDIRFPILKKIVHN